MSRLMAEKLADDSEGQFVNVFQSQRVWWTCWDMKSKLWPVGLKTGRATRVQLVDMKGFNTRKWITQCLLMCLMCSRQEVVRQLWRRTMVLNVRLNISTSHIWQHIHTLSDNRLGALGGVGYFTDIPRPQRSRSSFLHSGVRLVSSPWQGSFVMLTTTGDEAGWMISNSYSVLNVPQCRRWLLALHSVLGLIRN